MSGGKIVTLERRSTIKKLPGFGGLGYILGQLPLDNGRNRGNVAPIDK